MSIFDVLKVVLDTGDQVNIVQSDAAAASANEVSYVLIVQPPEENEAPAAGTSAATIKAAKARRGKAVGKKSKKGVEAKKEVLQVEDESGMAVYDFDADMGDEDDDALAGGEGGDGEEKKKTTKKSQQVCGSLCAVQGN